MKRFAFLVVLAGCLSAREAAPVSDDEQSLSRHLAELESLRAQAASPVPCPRVCDLAESICAVTQKICAITGRHADRADMADRCKDAQRTCEKSRDDCARQCRR